jgi:hypothetical protein
LEKIGEKNDIKKQRKEDVKLGNKKKKIRNIE